MDERYNTGFHSSLQPFGQNGDSTRFLSSVCGIQDYGNGEEFISSSVHDKSHIFHPEREHQELLFDITSWRDGKYCTKEERKLKYQIIKRAANRRDKMMRTLFLNVKTKEKMEDCANSWGHCAEVVPLREENS
uniref:Uncharacterized protein n=1 Tax=Rhizophagus irregularis (strain DAOM 181602 / DAOM 197198 / MUCL 43194) TaxID=747089 RepID=U9T035_RHIID